MESLFNKIADLFSPETLFKKGLQHRCFPVKFSSFLRTPIWRTSVNYRLLLPFETWHTSLPKLDLFLLLCIIPKQILKLIFMFHCLNLIASKFWQWAWFWTYFRKDSLCFIYLDVTIGQPQKKKSSNLLNFFFSCANEVKTCGIVQLILCMLRDLILQ